MVNFVCPVRSSETKSLVIVNPTNQRCRITPVVEGEHWTAAMLVTFEPHQNKTVDVTYQPLTMTTEEKKHLVQEQHLFISVMLHFTSCVTNRGMFLTSFFRAPSFSPSQTVEA